MTTKKVKPVKSKPSSFAALTPCILLIQNLQRRVEALEIKAQALEKQRSKAWVPGPFGTMQPP